MGFVIAMHGSGICVQRQMTLGIQKGLNCVQWPWCKREEIVFPTKPAEISKLPVLQGKPSVFWKPEKPSANCGIMAYARNPNTPVAEEMKRSRCKCDE